MSNKMTNETLETQFEELLLPSERGYGHCPEPLISEKTVEKTRKSIDLMVQLLQKEKGIDIRSPFSVTRGPNGSVDVLWKNEDYGALMNIPPAEKNEPVTYFWGKNDKSDRLKGELDF